MQLIKPDMWPLLFVNMLLLLVVVGSVGIYLVTKGKKEYRKGLKLRALLMIFPGLFMIGFVLYNWFGYNRIFTENERLIIGEYRSKTARYRLIINANHTWIIRGNVKNSCKQGTWKYVMSEDWNYWTLRSIDFSCSTQTGSPERICFKDAGVIVEK